jgi:hypothetical protein
VETGDDIEDTGHEGAAAFTLTFPPKRYILGQMKLGFTNETRGFTPPAYHGRNTFMSAHGRDLKRIR